MILDRIPGTVMAVGDNAYEFGSLTDYLLCYHPTWGRHRARTRPAAGNHEYLTPGAAGYFAYFFPDGAAPGGYYSYDLGRWHVVVLNSMTQWTACPPPKSSPDDGRTCVGDVAQRLWLIADLKTHRNRCTIAYFHHPRFSSARHGSQYEMQQFWDILYAAASTSSCRGTITCTSGSHRRIRTAISTSAGEFDSSRSALEVPSSTSSTRFCRTAKSGSATRTVCLRWR